MQWRNSFTDSSKLSSGLRRQQSTQQRFAAKIAPYQYTLQKKLYANAAKNLNRYKTAAEKNHIKMFKKNTDEFAAQRTIKKSMSTEDFPKSSPNA